MINIKKLLKKNFNDWSLVLKEARLVEERGDLADAILIYEAFLSKHPGLSGVLELHATACLKSGALAKSLKSFQRAIKLGAHQPHVFLHAGIAAAGLGFLDKALDFFNESLRLKPDYALAFNNLGKLYGDMGEAAEVLPCFDRALSLDENYVDAHMNRGTTLFKRGFHEEALASFERVLLLEPDHLQARYQKVLALGALGHLTPEEVVDALQVVIDEDPRNVDALNEMGLRYKQLNQLDDAMAAFERAIAIDSSCAPAYSNRGALLNDWHRHQEALADLEKAIQLKPSLAEAYVNRTLALSSLRRFVDALTSADEALKLNPSLPEAHVNRSFVLVKLQRDEEALEALNEAIRLNWDLAEAYINRSDLYRRLGQLDEAWADARQAMAIRPHLAEVYQCIALLHQESLEFDAALEAFDQALAHDPQYAESHFGKGLVHLLQGHLLEGARGYEWRWLGPLRDQVREFSRPLWLGEEPLAGKTLLVSSEQGLGDTIQYARFLPLLADQAKEVIVEVPAPLMSLLKTMEGPYRWVERGQSLPNTDFYCPFMSLPLALKTNLDTIPSETPYLFPSKEVCQRWQDLLGEKTRPRVGLAWSGNSQHVNHRNRSLPLALIHALLGAPFDFHVLQKDLTQEDRLSLKTMEHVFVHADALGDFADTAGLLRQMDLVISVDTSIAHLAGALGYPVWVLLPYLPDFRWMLERSDSPWYPSARLFRQPQRRDWEAVIGDVDAALKAKEF